MRRINALFAVLAIAVGQKAACPCLDSWEESGRVFYGCADFWSTDPWCWVQPGPDCSYTVTNNISWSYCEKTEIDCHDGTTGPFATDLTPPILGPCVDDAVCNWDNECKGGMCLPQILPTQLDPVTGQALTRPPVEFSCASCPDGSPYPCEDDSPCFYPFHCKGGFCNDLKCDSCSDGSPAPCSVGNECQSYGFNQQCESTFCALAPAGTSFVCVGCADGSKPPCPDDDKCWFSDMCEGNMCKPELDTGNGRCTRCTDGSAAPCATGSTCYHNNDCERGPCIATDLTFTVGECSLPTCGCVQEPWTVEGTYQNAPVGMHTGCYAEGNWCLAAVSDDCFYMSDQGLDWVECTADSAGTSTGTADSGAEGESEVIDDGSYSYDVFEGD
jgi:hypothetical protein